MISCGHVFSATDANPSSPERQNGDANGSPTAAVSVEVVSTAAGDDSAESSKKDPSSMSFPSIMHKDAFLIFRALCKLSMKGLHDDAISESSDMIAMQNK
jgi:hypothetical protein